MMAGHEKDIVRSFLGMHREMERFLNEAFRSGQSSSFTGKQSWNPSVDVFETTTSYVVKVELAGLDLDEVEVTFDDGELTISGCRRDRCTEARTSCHQMEIPYGDFKRTVPLSKDINGDGITADYVQGFLEILLPKSQEHRHKRIQIKVE